MKELRKLREGKKEGLKKGRNARMEGSKGNLEMKGKSLKKEKGDS